MADLDTLIARFEQRLKKLPQAELQVVTLTRSSEVLGQIYMFLLQKQEEAALQKAGTVTNNRILDHAEAADDRGSRRAEASARARSCHGRRPQRD